MTADPRWTPETEQLVAVAIHQADCEADLDECLADHAHARAARQVLTALADAGLLPPGSGEVEIDQLRADVDHLRAERDRLQKDLALTERHSLRDETDMRQILARAERAEAGRDVLAARLERAEQVVEAAQVWRDQAEIFKANHEALIAVVNAHDQATPSTSEPALDPQVAAVLDDTIQAWETQRDQARQVGDVDRA